MDIKKRYQYILLSLFFFFFFGIAFFSYYFINVSKIPDNISIYRGREETLSFLPEGFILPITGVLTTSLDKDGQEIQNPAETESITVSQYAGTKKLSSDLLHLNLQKKVSIEAKEQGSYQLELRCFNVIVKKIRIQVLEEQDVIPCGNIVGIYGKTDGILVLGTGEVTDIHGKTQEPAYHLVRSGDYITAVNDTVVSSKEELITFLEQESGNAVKLTLRRGEKEVLVSITPVQTSTEGWKLGIWVRSDTQGIGTLTFRTEDGNFGALGHAITDIDIGEILTLSSAGLYQAETAAIRKGSAGDPGELSGIIHMGEDYCLGSITENTYQGIYGILCNSLPENTQSKAIPAALKQEIHTGKAEIYSQLDGDITTYEVEIEKIDKNPDTTSKSMIVHITDHKLLKKTNGIIQGMSGSPIVQDGKFIGAVTHVFVNDPTRGYGILAEHMLYHLQN